MSQNDLPPYAEDIEQREKSFEPYRRLKRGYERALRPTVTNVKSRKDLLSRQCILDLTLFYINYSFYNLRTNYESSGRI